MVSPPSDSVSSLSFSPKANFLVATSWDNQVSLFSLVSVDIFFLSFLFPSFFMFCVCICWIVYEWMLFFVTFLFVWSYYWCNANDSSESNQSSWNSSLLLGASYYLENGDRSRLSQCASTLRAQLYISYAVVMYANVWAPVQDLFLLMQSSLWLLVMLFLWWWLGEFQKQTFFVALVVGRVNWYISWQFFLGTMLGGNEIGNHNQHCS